MSRKKRKLMKQKIARQQTLEGNRRKRWMHYMPQTLNFCTFVSFDDHGNCDYVGDKKITLEEFDSCISKMSSLSIKHLSSLLYLLRERDDNGGIMIDKGAKDKYFFSAALHHRPFWDYLKNKVEFLILEKTILKG